MAVTEDNTNLRRRSTLPGELADLVNDLFGSGLEPGRGGTRVGDGRARNALSLAVKTTHFDLLARVMKLVVVVVDGCCRAKMVEVRDNFFCGLAGWSVGHVRRVSLKGDLLAREI